MKYQSGIQKDINGNIFMIDRKPMPSDMGCSFK